VRPGVHRTRGVGCRRAGSRCRAPPVANSAALLLPSAAGEAAKATLLGRLKVVENRGIFGLPVRKEEEDRLTARPPSRAERALLLTQDVERHEIDALARELEACSPVEAPTERLGSHVAGTWRLLYTTVRETRFPAVVGPRVTSLSRSSLSLSTSTSPGSFGLGEQITIRGGTRTKLGLRGALTLGELQQVITCDGTGACGDAINNVAFSLAGMAQGSFTVAARYSVASPTRCVRVQNTHTHTHTRRVS
jgi:hypothetical protein